MCRGGPTELAEEVKQGGKAADDDGDSSDYNDDGNYDDNKGLSRAAQIDLFNGLIILRKVAGVDEMCGKVSELREGQAEGILLPQPDRTKERKVEGLT